MIDNDADVQIRTFIDNQFPDFVKKHGPKLIEFVKVYYTWLESQNNTQAQLNKVKEYFDVDTAPEKFFRFMQNEFLSNMPENTLVNKQFLLKNIQDFYRARGSEKSFRLLFRILFNEEIEFYYPGKDILRTSSGNWYVEKELTVDPLVLEDDLFSYGGKEIIGQTTKARARVDRIYSYVENGVFKFIISYTSLSGHFDSDEFILNSARNIKIGKITNNNIKPGRYLDTNGFLSSDKKLQDRDYYQEYSYVLRSGQPNEKYNDAVNTLVHPAGTKRFSDFYLVRDIEIDISQSSLPIDLEFEVLFPVVIQFFSDIAYGSSDNLLEILIEFFTEFSFDADFYPTVYEEVHEEVVLHANDTINSFKDYSINDLSRVKVGDAANKMLITGITLNSSEFLVEIANNQNFILYDKLNKDNEYAYLTAADVVSNSAIILTQPYYGNTVTINEG